MRSLLMVESLTSGNHTISPLRSGIFIRSGITSPLRLLSERQCRLTNARDAMISRLPRPLLRSEKRSSRSVST